MPVRRKILRWSSAFLALRLRCGWGLGSLISEMKTGGFVPPAGGLMRRRSAFCMLRYCCVGGGVVRVLIVKRGKSAVNA